MHPSTAAPFLNGSIQNEDIADSTIDLSKSNGTLGLEHGGLGINSFRANALLITNEDSTRIASKVIAGKKGIEVVQNSDSIIIQSEWMQS